MSGVARVGPRTRLRIVGYPFEEAGRLARAGYCALKRVQLAQDCVNARLRVTEAKAAKQL